MHLRIFLICTATSRLGKYWSSLSSFGQCCSLYADRRSPRKYNLLLPTNFTWILVCCFFSPQTNMLLFATNQTNLKQKQNFSVFKLCKYWSRMHRWSGIFSCILAVHVLKEAFSVFIVSCLLYLLSKFWVAGKNQNWFPCAFERWVIWGAGRGEGRRVSEFLVEQGLNYKCRTHAQHEFSRAEKMGAGGRTGCCTQRI